MDRAIQMPLQGVPPAYRMQKPSNGEVRRLRCLVVFCLVLELFLAFPVVYLLGAHLRELQPPKQQVAAGPEPTMGKYSALSAGAEKRPMAHLRAENPENVFCANCSHICHWIAETLEQCNYSNGKLEIQRDGDYFVYSRVNFEGREEECKKRRASCDPSSPIQVKQEVFKGSEKYGGHSYPILTGSTTVNAQSMGPKFKPWRKSIYLGAVFSLKAGDRLMVKVSHMELVLLRETFFGVASLN